MNISDSVIETLSKVNPYASTALLLVSGTFLFTGRQGFLYAALVFPLCSFVLMTTAAGIVKNSRAKHEVRWEIARLRMSLGRAHAGVLFLVPVDKNLWQRIKWSKNTVALAMYKTSTDPALVGPVFGVSSKDYFTLRLAGNIETQDVERARESISKYAYLSSKMLVLDD